MSAKRRPNFTKSEKLALVKSIRDRSHILSEKFSNQVSKELKNQAWKEVFFSS